MALTRVERTRRRRCTALPPRDGAIDRARRSHASPSKPTAATQPADIESIEAAGAAWWPLAMARELDDAILSMRTNELDIGTWILKPTGDAAAVLANDAALVKFASPSLAGARDHWP